MKKTRYALVITGALAAAACHDAGPGLGLDVAAAPASVRMTEAVAVTTTVVNLSSRVISVPAANTCGLRPFDVFDALGRQVEFPGVVCLLVLRPPVELQPGETIEYDRTWTPASTSIDGQPAGTGRYRVVGKFLHNEEVSVRSHAEVEVVP
jgi:hypothetical protein